MIEHIGENQVSLEFSDMIDVMDTIDDLKAGNFKNKSNKYIFENEYAMKVRRFDGDWFCSGIESTEEVIEKSTYGDDYIHDKILAPKISELNEVELKSEDLYNVKRVKRKRIKSDFGDEVDIHAVNQGKLDVAWSRTKREEIDQEHHLVTLLINIGGRGNIDADKAMWTAAAALKINDILQQTGKNVQIIVANFSAGTTSMGMGLDWSVCLKKYSDHLSTQRLALMSNITFYRSVGFCLKTASSKAINPNLGSSRSFNKNTIPKFLKDEVKAGHTKMLIVDKCTDKQGAIRAIQEINKIF